MVILMSNGPSDCLLFYNNVTFIADDTSAIPFFHCVLSLENIRLIKNILPLLLSA